MFVVGILNTKGGVGKSTLTACLSVRAAQERLGKGKDQHSMQVAVVDLDPQESVSDWHKRRGSPGNPTLFTGEDRASDAVTALLGTSAEMVFLDGAPGAMPLTIDAISACDLVVIPTRASSLDMLAMQDVVRECLGAGRDFLVVLNAIGARADRMADNARDSLLNYQIPIAKTAIKQRVGYVDAMTRGKSGPEKDEAAREEIDALWAEVFAAVKAARAKKVKATADAGH